MTIGRTLAKRGIRPMPVGFPAGAAMVSRVVNDTGGFVLNGTGGFVTPGGF